MEQSARREPVQRPSDEGDHASMGVAKNALEGCERSEAWEAVCMFVSVLDTLFTPGTA